MTSTKSPESHAHAVAVSLGNQTTFRWLASRLQQENGKPKKDQKSTPLRSSVRALLRRPVVTFLLASQRRGESTFTTRARGQFGVPPTITD